MRDSEKTAPHFVAFAAYEKIAEGPLTTLGPLVEQALRAQRRVLVFNAVTGTQVDSDQRGDWQGAPTDNARPAPGRGRPKLGVVRGEVTLLPRHWSWLKAQPGGASVVLRRLVEQARKAEGGVSDGQSQRAAQDACYRFLSAIAGDLPNYEEVLRMLYRRDGAAFRQLMADWPPDIRGQAVKMAAAACA